MSLIPCANWIITKIIRAKVSFTIIVKHDQSDPSQLFITWSVGLTKHCIIVILPIFHPIFMLSWWQTSRQATSFEGRWSSSPMNISNTVGALIICLPSSANGLHTGFAVCDVPAQIETNFLPTLLTFSLFLISITTVTQVV